MPKSFYESDGVKITDGFVQGNGVAYQLDGIVGVESGLSAGWLVASGAVLLLATLLAWSPLFQSSSASYQFLVAVQAVSTVVFIAHCIYRPVVVRTASGVTRLAAWKAPAERRRMVEAFISAKQSVTAPQGSR
jgi:hypothetical protein